MTLDTHVLLRALRRQASANANALSQQTASESWHQIEGACTALLEVHEQTIDIPSHVVSRVARQSLALDGLRDLAEHVHDISNQDQALALVREPWVIDVYGRTAWSHLEFLLNRREPPDGEQP